MAAEDYSIYAKIDADSSGFTSAVNSATASLDGFGADVSSLTGNISSGLESWGLNFSKFYSKGSSIFKDFGIDIDAFASKLGTSGPVVAAITTATVALTKFGQKMNTAFSEIVKGTGATGEKLLELKDTTKNVLAQGVASDVATVSGMIADINTRFGSTGEELENLTLSFESFSQATGVDARDAINETADIMKKWGIDVEDTPALLDEVTKAAQDSGIGVNKLMSGLKSGQAVFSQFGMSATESIAYLSQLSKAGIDTETAMMGMKNALNNFAKEGLNAEEALKATTDAIKNAKSDTEALQIASSVFGSKAGPEMVQVFKNGADSIAEYAVALETAGGTMESTQEASRTSVQAFAELQNQLKGTFSSFGEGFDIIFRDLIDIVSDFVSFLDPIISPIGDIFRDVFQYIGGLLKTLADYFVEFQTRYNVIWQNVCETLERVKEFVHKSLGRFLQIFKDCFGLIFAILEGKWELAWQYTKRILLNSIASILDGLSMILNGFNSMINKIVEKINFLIEKINPILEFFKMEPMKLVDEVKKVDLTRDTGLGAMLDATTKRINELTGESTKAITGDLGQVTSSTLQTANATADLTKKQNENSQSVKEQAVQYGKAVDMLKLYYEQALKGVENAEGTAQEQFEIKRKYLLDELAVFEEKNEKERAEALATAKTEADVAIINENYDNQLAEHRLKTIDTIIDAEKNLASTRRDYAIQTHENLVELYKMNAEDELKRLEETGASERAITQEKIKQVQDLYDMESEIVQMKMEDELKAAKSVEEAELIRQKYALETRKLERDYIKEIDSLTKEYGKNTKVTFKDVAKSIVDVFGKVSSAVGKIISKTAKITVSIFNGIKSILMKAFDFNPDEALDSLLVFEDKVLTFFVETLPQLPSFLESALQSVAVLLDNVIMAINPSAIGDLIKRLLDAVMSALPDIVDTAFELVKEVVNLISTKIPDMIPQLVTLVEKILDGLTETLSDSVPKLVKGVVSIVKQLIKSLPKIIKLLGKAIVQLLPVFVSVISEALPDLIKAIIETLPEIVSAIIEVIPMIIAELIKAIPTLGNAVLEVVKSIGDYVWSGLEWIWNQVASFFSTVVDWFKGIGQNIADALTAPVKGIGSVFEEIGNIGSNIWGGIKGLFGFETGTPSAPSGLALVGEAGPELVNFRGGEQVLNARNTQKALTGMGSNTNNFNVTFNNVTDTSSYALMKKLKAWNRELAINGIM